MARRIDPEREEVVGADRADEQQDETGFAPGVKHQARQTQDGIPEAEGQVVEPDDDGQEVKEKRDGAENHCCCISIMWYVVSGDEGRALRHQTKSLPGDDLTCPPGGCPWRTSDGPAPMDSSQVDSVTSLVDACSQVGIHWRAETATDRQGVGAHLRNS